jgi:hypothetical protein
MQFQERFSRRLRLAFQHLSPLGRERINLTGDFVWRQSWRADGGQFRPLRLNGKA